MKKGSRSFFGFTLLSIKQLAPENKKKINKDIKMTHKGVMQRKKKLSGVPPVVISGTAICGILLNRKYFKDPLRLSFQVL